MMDTILLAEDPPEQIRSERGEFDQRVLNLKT
jgi:hypothetical protein